MGRHHAADVLQRQLGLRDHTTFSLIGRLKAGTTADQAAQDLTSIRKQELAEVGGDEARAIRLRSAEYGELPRLGPERPNDTKQARLIASAVAIVLIVACVNMISESIALKYFGKESAIGRPVPKDVDRRFSTPTEIVGVVKEIKTGYR